MSIRCHTVRFEVSVSVLVPVHVLPDPAVVFPHIGVDPGDSLRGAADPPADDPDQTGLSTVLETDQGTSGVSLARVLQHEQVEQSIEILCSYWWE